MKLLTRIMKRYDGKHVLCVDIDAELGPDEVAGECETIHDAAYAHALMQAIHNRIDRARDAGEHYSSRRLEGIIQYADEIMREWGFDSAETTNGSS